MNDKQRKAMFAKNPIRGKVGFDELDDMVNVLRKTNLLSQKMTMAEVVNTYKKNFGGNATLDKHVNPNYRGFHVTVPVKQSWDILTKKQQFLKLKPIATDEWAKKYAGRKWDELSKEEKGFLESAHSDLARLENAKRRDPLHVGFMIHTENGRNVNHKFKGE